MQITCLIAAGVGLLSLASTAHADTGTGWYFGMGAGGSNYSGDVPQQIANAYRNNHTYTLVTARVVDSGDRAWQAFAGYRFLPWLGAELAYQDLGNAKTFYQLKTIGPILYPMPTLNGEYGLRDFDATLVAQWPVRERWSLLARGGVSDTRLTYDEHGVDVNAQAYAFHARARTRTGGLFGIGAVWEFAPQLALRFDVDRRFDIGKTFALDAESNGRFDHVDAYTLSLVWKP